MGLIDETGLQHVCMEAALDLRRARARYAIDNVDWAKCVRQLNKDIKAANDFLSDELKVAPSLCVQGALSQDWCPYLMSNCASALPARTEAAHVLHLRKSLSR